MATPKKNKFDLTPETREKYINEIIGFFQEERGEEMGIIAAGNVLDFILDLVGMEIYRKGITDSKKLIKQKLLDLEVELDSLT